MHVAFRWAAAGAAADDAAAADAVVGVAVFINPDWVGSDRLNLIFVFNVSHDLLWAMVCGCYGCCLNEINFGLTEIVVQSKPLHGFLCC